MGLAEHRNLLQQESEHVMLAEPRGLGGAQMHFTFLQLESRDQGERVHIKMHNYKTLYVITDMF